MAHSVPAPGPSQFSLWGSCPCSRLPLSPSGLPHPWPASLCPQAHLPPEPVRKPSRALTSLTWLDSRSCVQRPVVNVTFSPSLPHAPTPALMSVLACFLFTARDKGGPFLLPSILRDQGGEWAQFLGAPLPKLSRAFPQPSRSTPLQDGGSQSVGFPTPPPSPQGRDHFRR